MDNVNNLLEGSSPYQVLSEQSAKLAGKWEKSGLLEGIEASVEKNNMAMLLENQAKQLVNEASSTGTNTSITTGNSEAWAGVALPLVRRVFGEIVAKDLVSVQPMNLPAGLIFYLDFKYGTAGTNTGLNESLYGATTDLKRTNADLNTGLYGAGEFDYSMETTSSVISAAHATTTDETDTYVTASFNYLVDGNGDSEFSSSFGDNFGVQAAHGDTTVFVVKVDSAGLKELDLEGIRAFSIAGANQNADGVGSVEGLNKIVEYFPQFTKQVGTDIEFVVRMATGSGQLGKLTIEYQKGPDNLNDRGDFEDTTFAQVGDTGRGIEIPEINVNLRSDTVAAKTRKLKAQWTPEFAQDLNAYHSIDAEAELTSILSEYISMEIDLEILDMLIKNADTIEAWSARVGYDASVNNNNATTGAAGTAVELTQSQTQATDGVYYTKMSWFQTLGIKLQKVSNLIHQKTLRGGANFMVVSPKVSTILESIPGFAADSAGDQNKYAMGVQKIGAINSRYTVYKNPYMTENVILMGYKGSQFLETGAVFAPYIPLIMTPLVYDPSTFTPRKGIMTRYAKKMVRPDFYGKVFIQDLNLV
jgi:hypothetical protein